MRRYSQLLNRQLHLHAKNPWKKHIIFSGQRAQAYIFDIIFDPNNAEYLTESSVIIFDNPSQQSWLEKAHPSRDLHRWGQALQEMPNPYLQIAKTKTFKNSCAKKQGDTLRTSNPDDMRLTFSEIRKLDSLLKNEVFKNEFVKLVSGMVYKIEKLPDGFQIHYNQRGEMNVIKLPEKSHFYNFMRKARFMNPVSAQDHKLLQYSRVNVQSIMEIDKKIIRQIPRIITVGAGLSTAWLQRESGAEIYCIRLANQTIPSIEANKNDIDLSKIFYIDHDKIIMKHTSQVAENVIRITYIDEYQQQVTVEALLVWANGYEYDNSLLADSDVESSAITTNIYKDATLIHTQSVPKGSITGNCCLFYHKTTSPDVNHSLKYLNLQCFVYETFPTLFVKSLGLPESFSENHLYFDTIAIKIKEQAGYIPRDELENIYLNAFKKQTLLGNELGINVNEFSDKLHAFLDQQSIPSWVQNKNIQP